jgi:threonine/homoserine/homoserine lactone efflux protein
MDVGLLGRGALLGFAIAAPVGPIGVLCIRRTLAEGRAVGFVSGLGAATADACYGALAAFGLTLVTGVLVSQAFSMRLVGCLFLCYLGVITLLAQPAGEAAETKTTSTGLLGAYLSTLALTITNPITILSFAGVFAGVGLVGGSDYGGAALLVLGVFLGSAAWWLLLSGGVSLLRSRVTPAMLIWINRLSGAIILAFGLWQGWLVLSG